jgi:hypothetical protein
MSQARSKVYQKEINRMLKGKMRIKRLKWLRMHSKVIVLDSNPGVNCHRLQIITNLEKRIKPMLKVSMLI